MHSCRRHLGWHDLLMGLTTALFLLKIPAPGHCLAGAAAGSSTTSSWGSQLAMVDAVWAFCRCADSMISYKAQPENLYKYDHHVTELPAEKLLAGMVTSLGLRSAAQVREFCREESARLLPVSGSSVGNCTGLFSILTYSGPLLSAISLSLCRRGWVFWDYRKPRPDSIPGIADCAATAPRLLWTRYSHPYDPQRGFYGQVFSMFNEHPINDMLGDKGHMYELVMARAANKSSQCLASFNALIPRTYRLYDTKECQKFFASELRGGRTLSCGGSVVPNNPNKIPGGVAGAGQACESVKEEPSTLSSFLLSAAPVTPSGADGVGVRAGAGTEAGGAITARAAPALGAVGADVVPVAASCQDTTSETWWLVKVTNGYKSQGHGLIVPSLHFNRDDHSKSFRPERSPCTEGVCPDKVDNTHRPTSRDKDVGNKKPTQNRLEAYGPWGEHCEAINKAGKPREIVTEYIRRPLLVEGRKFHIRAYVGMAAADPLTVFFHPAYAKFSQRAYDSSPEHASDPFRHFTNTPNPNTEFADVMWTFDELDWYLSAVAGKVNPGYVNATLVPLFKQVAVFLMRLLHDELPTKYEGFFQEYSLDFFLDETLRVYFLEVNTTTGTRAYDLTFFRAFINAVEDLRLARERRVWPREEKASVMLPKGMHLGGMELIIYNDWDIGGLEGCEL